MSDPLPTLMVGFGAALQGAQRNSGINTPTVEFYQFAGEAV
jgi:hypothetical protein